MSHAINHTCHPGFVNCRFVLAGIVGGRSEDEQGGIGGRRTSEVFVKTTRRVESDAELFANYGTKFWFAGGCVCHSCHLEEMKSDFLAQSTFLDPPLP